jgi:hypothetical protein
MGKGGWSSPFSQRMIDGWAAHSKKVGAAERAQTVRQNILNTCRRHKLAQPSTHVTPMTDQELYDEIVQLIHQNGEVVSGYGLVLDGADTVAQLIMNLLIETGRSIPSE